MASLKLIMEKGPREGETLEYNCRSVIKIGRVARGNTFAIKDDGISSKHICIRFDNNQWNLTDLDSSNGTVLNGEPLEPFLPSGLNDGDCIKIGEITSILVKIENILSESNRNPRPRRQGKSEAKVKTVVNVDEVKSELGLGLGFDEGDLGKSGVEVVEKRNLRSRVKKMTENLIESGLSCRRNLRSSRKEITEDLNLNENDVREPKKTTRGGRKKKEVSIYESLPEGKEAAGEVEELMHDGNEEGLVKDDVRELKKTTRGRKKNEVLVDKSSGDGKEVAEEDVEEVRQDGDEKGLVQDDVREPKKTTRGRKKNEVSFDESLPEGKEVAEEVEESRQDGHETVVVDESLLQGNENGSEEGLVKEASDLKWQDFEKMTVEDFFDYLEVQLPKDIREASEKTMVDLADKTRKCYELNVLKL